MSVKGKPSRSGNRALQKHLYPEGVSTISDDSRAYGLERCNEAQRIERMWATTKAPANPWDARHPQGGKA